jgi:hypothetical protein
MYTLDREVTIPVHHESAIISLAYKGYLGSSPTSPQIAISLRTLELYRRLRLRQPSFSVYAFSKVLCDYYGFPYKRQYRNALASAFEIYIRMDTLLNTRLQTALGRTGEYWRVQNACPPCNYKVIV